MCEQNLIIPGHDPDEPEGYPDDIRLGEYGQSGIVALLREPRGHPLHRRHAGGVRCVSSQQLRDTF